MKSSKIKIASPKSGLYIGLESQKKDVSYHCITWLHKFLLLLLYDNAKLHTSCATLGTLQKTKFEALSHPPYNPRFGAGQFPFLSKSQKGSQEDSLHLRWSEASCQIMDQTKRPWILNLWHVQACLTIGKNMINDKATM